MWAGIAGSVALLLGLLARGWGGVAWPLAAGVLLVICVGACVWAAVSGERSAREVDDAVARLAASRHEDERRRAPSKGDG